MDKWFILLWVFLWIGLFRYVFGKYVWCGLWGNHRKGHEMKQGTFTCKKCGWWILKEYIEKRARDANSRFD
jgi:hypothetical protein